MSRSSPWAGPISIWPTRVRSRPRLLRHGQTCTANDIIVHRPDGRRVPLFTWAAPIDLNRIGRPEAAVWVLEDLSALQQAEFASEAKGYTATRHQREVGTGYFDAIASAVSGGEVSTVALKESTEAAQCAPQQRVAAE